MGEDMLLAIGCEAAVGLIMVTLTLWVSRRNLTAALMLCPFSVVVSLSAGLLVGLHLMLIEGAALAALLVISSAPVAAAVGVFVVLRTQRLLREKHEALSVAQRDREVERGKRELLSWLSHDLKTPLAGIRAMGEALEDGMAKDPARYYALIVRDAKRTTEMVEEMLSLASMESSHLQLASERLCLRDVVSDAVSQVASAAERRGMRFRAEMRTEQLEAVGDASLLGRALLNVLNNAVKYSVEGSELVVSLERFGDSARIGVRDACGGIDEETRSRMFEVGWRGSSARTPDAEGGSGLGLAIVQRIVEAHGGRVWVEPAPCACRVVIELPLV